MERQKQDPSVSFSLVIGLKLLELRDRLSSCLGDRIDHPYPWLSSQVVRSSIAPKSRSASPRDSNCAIDRVLIRSSERSLLTLHLQCLKLCDRQTCDFRDRLQVKLLAEHIEGDRLFLLDPCSFFSYPLDRRQILYVSWLSWA
jgi:hypothetical protein